MWTVQDSDLCLLLYESTCLFQTGKTANRKKIGIRTVLFLKRDNFSYELNDHALALQVKQVINRLQVTKQQSSKRFKKLAEMNWADSEKRFLNVFSERLQEFHQLRLPKMFVQFQTAQQESGLVFRWRSCQKLTKT